jgi:hypothetical protein
MNVRIVHINLPKPCDPVIYTRLSEQVQGAVVLGVTVKRQLRAGKEADGHLGFANGGEAAGDRFRKISGYELISDLSGARGNEVKTVIAHRRGLLSSTATVSLTKPILIAVIDLDQHWETKYALPFFFAHKQDPRRLMRSRALYRNPLAEDFKWK